MFGKLFLIVAFVLSLSAGTFAQSEMNFQKDYDDWLKAHKQSLNGALFVGVKAKRMNAKNVVIHIAIGKHTDNFQISARLVKIEKDTEGKIVIKSISGAERDVVDNNSDSTEYAERSYIKVKGSQKANAFEVLITVAGKEPEKIILEISDKYSYKTFSSID
ncbi:MAG TPA: hypothetical protein VGB02_10320 [Pyrinomonadaceae bacterium]|jgi:hypothetical protein